MKGAKKQNAGTRPAVCCYQNVRGRLLSNHVDDNFSEYFAVNLEVHFVLANVTQNAVRQANFALSNFNACCSNSVSDVASTDGTEQFTFVASFRRDGYGFQGVDLLSTSFSCCQNVSQFGFQFSDRDKEGFLQDKKRRCGIAAPPLFIVPVTLSAWRPTGCTWPDSRPAPPHPCRW